MSSDDDDGPDPVVLDNGSGSIKAGFAGHKTLRTNFPACVGKREGLNDRDQAEYVGEACQRRRSILNLHYPINHGIITDWVGMETLWHHALEDKLRIDPRHHPLLMTEPPRNPMYNRQKMAQILFESLQVPALYVAVPALLSLYASGRVSGLVTESGAGNTHMLAIVDGFCIKAATHRSPLAGRQMTDYLVQLLNQKGYSFATSAEREVVREIKECLCYVAEDYQTEMSHSPVRTKHYQLPDGQTIDLGQETFQCMEAMFRPSLLDSDRDTKFNYKCGITDMMNCALRRCNVDVRATLYENIIVTGGNTMHRGFSKRVKKELQHHAPRSMNVIVVSPPERKKSVWIGGSILASLTNYKGMWMTQEEYQEYGPAIVHRNGSMIFDPER